LLRKLIRLLVAPPLPRRIIAEAVLYLAWARVLKALPFSKVAPSLGVPMQETSATSSSPEEAETVKKIARVIKLTSKHTWWESMCLVRAIAAMKMLERRHIESTLYLGTAKDESGKMIAHAWLRSGPLCVTGGEEMPAFTEVGRFGKRMHSEMKEHG